MFGQMQCRGESLPAANQRWRVSQVLFDEPSGDTKNLPSFSKQSCWFCCLKVHFSAVTARQLSSDVSDGSEMWWFSFPRTSLDTCQHQMKPSRPDMKRTITVQHCSCNLPSAVGKNPSIMCPTVPLQLSVLPSAVVLSPSRVFLTGWIKNLDVYLFY